MKKRIVYKIRDKETGLFANKGFEFKKQGTMFSSLEKVKSNLLFFNTIEPKIYESIIQKIEIVKLEIIEIKSLNVMDIITN